VQEKGLGRHDKHSLDIQLVQLVLGVVELLLCLHHSLLIPGWAAEERLLQRQGQLAFTRVNLDSPSVELLLGFCLLTTGLETVNLDTFQGQG